MTVCSLHNMDSKHLLILVCAHILVNSKVQSNIRKKKEGDCGGSLGDCCLAKQEGRW